MTTAIDTNVLVALWKETEKESLQAQQALDEALARGRLVVSGAVFADLMAFPSRNEQFLHKFFFETGISIDWEMTDTIWRAAGRAFQDYRIRRRRSGSSAPRRILADFVIGAHASVNRYTLLTLDHGFYAKDFPGLKLGAIP